MPGATKNMGHAWYIGAVLLSALGFYMWPHIFGATFTAKSGNIPRPNAVVMPLYSITLVFIFFAGFAAALVGAQDFPSMVPGRRRRGGRRLK